MVASNVKEHTRAKVSVIIPVYGVEQYIERCAISLFEQTLDDIEYIFVNDCTRDRSIEVLTSVIERYPNRKSQVKIIEMPQNSGQAAVRKRGLEIASGEYIIHCDSDDWIDLTMYEKMYKTAVDQNCDIVICDFNIVTQQGQYHKTQVIPSDRIMLLRSLLNERTHGSLCNKLIRANLYHQIDHYPQDNLLEDLTYSIQLIFEFLRDNDLYELLTTEVRHLQYATKYQLRHICLTPDGQAKWNETYPEINTIKIINTNFSATTKLIYLITSFGLYPLVWKIKKLF